jgi:glutathione S-transferase
MKQLTGMTLYSGGRAPNPRRVQIFLAIKELAIDTVELDINRLDQRSEWFTKINPMRTLPVLVLADGAAIAETVAICRYLEAEHAEPSLLGRNAREAAMIEMWQRRVELGLFMPVAFAFRHLHPGAAILEQPQIPDWGQANQGRARAFMEFLDRELSARKHVAGEAFSIADITAIAAYQFLRAARIPAPTDLAHLSRWYRDVSAVPGVVIGG